MHAQMDAAVSAFHAAKWSEVVRLCTLILQERPRNVRALRLAALAHKSLGTQVDYLQGCKLLLRAVELKPTLHVYKELILLRKLAGTEDPSLPSLVELYRQALRIDKCCEWANLGLVNSLCLARNDREVVRAVDAAIRTLGEGKRSKILYQQAKAYFSIQDWDSCSAICSKILADEPANDLVAFLLAATLQKKPSLQTKYNESCPASTAPKEYVSSLYDGYADHFDEHLLKLKYKTPQLLHDLVRKAFPSATWKRGLDLGCGTGLSGIVFASSIEEFHGVDLSQKMLDKAASRMIYNGGLWKNDVLQCFESFKDLRFDFVLSSDVFVYIGDLAEIVRAVSEHLSEGGVFAFSCEALERVSFAEGASREDFQLCPTRRFAHSCEYLKRICNDAGLSLAAIRKNATLRRQAGLPVRGHLMCFQKD